MDRKKYLAILSVVVTSSLYMNICKAEVGWIEGTVTDADSGSPLADTQIFAKSVPKNVSGTTNSSGSYRLEVPAGTYNVIANSFCRPIHTVSVSVSAGETITQDFALTYEGPCVGGLSGGTIGALILFCIAAIVIIVIVILAIVYTVYKLGTRKEEKTEQTASCMRSLLCVCGVKFNPPKPNPCMHLINL